ncbi:MAG TPA: tRNA epoxyqueuosine(34) reductase QueG [Anaerolineales bacterium]|nr:tRNA epoxyqueuosine(34) reductase QueG [Anaerolineales bacterium]
MPVDRRPLTHSIKAQAYRLGFQLVGVTTPEPPPHLSFYERWLAAGYHGEMAYLASERARQRRADPRLVLPGCQSILVLGVRYPSPESQPQLGDSHPYRKTPRGQVASYAWGDDYHDALPVRLEALADFIAGQVGGPVAHRSYTDSGPLLERELAQRAGLGWIGKNTCLIHPRQGSYFLLAELLLDVELEPDPPFQADHCGSCTRCIEACPTGCILPDRTLDARRCISYLTIELKGAIPLQLRPRLGEWVFGCDICQQVCPWNRRFASPEGDPAFAPRPGLPAPDLLAELALSQADFSRKFKGSPLKRARRRGYLRNVALALGNTLAEGNAAGPAALPALAQVLQHDPEPLVRGHAAWAMGQIGGRAAREFLEHALEGEDDEGVREEIRAALKSPET